jgi:putative endonuclease
MRRMHEGSYFAYIMASRSHTLYIGVTGDLRKRVFQHKWKEHEGFTARYNCDRLVWFERYQDVHKAITREKELKGWRRSKKIVLIEPTNPIWADLSRDWYECEPADYRRALDRMETEKQPRILCRCAPQDDNAAGCQNVLKADPES